MSDFIDLGSKPEKMMGASPKAPAVYYPHLSITSSNETGLPDEGEAVIRFKKIEEAHRKDASGEPQYRCELEIMGIKPMGTGKSYPMPKPKGKSFSESLDAAASAKEESDEMPGMEDD